MRRNAIVTIVVVLALLALGAQLAIPAYVSSRVEDRLTEDGGSAHVEVHAFPAWKLIGGGGDRIKVRGKGLKFDPVTPDVKVFDGLDDFGEVDAELTNAQSGPFAVQSFSLKRNGEGEPYSLSIQATSTARELTAYAASRFGGPLGRFMGSFAGGLMPFDDTPVPVRLQADVRSADGRAEVVNANGDVAGLPAGPFARALAAAVANAL